MSNLDLSSLAHIPTASAKRIALRVTPAAEHALRQGHPWLFDQAIREQSHDGASGDLAVIFDSQRRFLAIGLYDPHSPIRVRILQHREPAPINREWFAARLKAAAQIRAALPANITGYRLVHGENDGLPGLVIDRYDKTLVLELYTSAWMPHLREVLSILNFVIPIERLVLRLSREVQKQPAHLCGLRDGSVLSGPAIERPMLFLENGLRFEADPIRGQKTGFFFDQRDNRARVEKLAGGKSVLNVFAYTGAFSVYAARGGAREVVSVDISKPAMKAAQRNFAHNQQHPAVAACRHKTLTGDAFAVLRQFGNAGQRFDMVIIDPPAFAKQKAEAAQALAAYERLTRLGLNVLEPGGIFVQTSCSSRVSAEEFFEAVHRAAREVGHPLREIERTGHALDHPIGFKDGAYLKCMFAVSEH
ncbi:MAG: class I SAM-dependent rRNA methyltransferase [Chloroflexi bacterium]|nr:class I SAM-dependent rRNA methyltransferase [Chloroflexota bacterium]MBU1659840.1 class I SAM-dependent rRNA methyltransferase [Chloroflexota bacterium]